MTRPAKKKEPEIELRPDGWDRFKRAVAAAAKAGPKHRKGKESPRDGKSEEGGQRNST